MHHFFAYVARLRYIRRWGLMRSVMPENDAEHSLQVAMIAHAIAVIGRDSYGRDCNPEHILALGAGGISKRIYEDEGHIGRAPNVANIEHYIARVDEMTQRKRELFGVR